MKTFAKIFAAVFTSFLVVLIAMILFLYLKSHYYVGVNEQVVILQFGNVIGDPVDEPGDYYRVPLIQIVKRYKKEITTIVTLQNDQEYEINWRILDPIRLYLSGKTEDEIPGQLKDRFNNKIEIESSDSINKINEQLQDIGIEIESITLSN